MERIGDWRSVDFAPRDGTPIVLWLKHDEAPPVYPVTVGFWITRDPLEIRRWLIFGDPGSILDREDVLWLPCRPPPAGEFLCATAGAGKKPF
jgi:hypothetical protein